METDRARDSDGLAVEGVHIGKLGHIAREDDRNYGIASYGITVRNYGDTLLFPEIDFRDLRITVTRYYFPKLISVLS